MSGTHRIKCKICGREFESSYKHATLCSDECRQENKKLHARKQHVQKTAERREKNSTLTRTCGVCGKEFHSKNWNQIMCSKECVLVHRRKAQSIYKKEKRQEVVKVITRRNRKSIPLVQDSLKAEEAGTTYGKYALIPYLAKQSEEMAKHRRELDAEWEKKRNEKKNGQIHDEVLL